MTRAFRKIRYPLNFMSDVIFMIMSPLTRPTPEFHRTCSPNLERFRHRNQP